MTITKVVATGAFVLSTALALGCETAVETELRGGEHTTGDHHDKDKGCVLTQGFWKNHPEAWPTDGEVCGIEWLDILHTPPKGGNAWIILAHQWIAASLNVAAGAGTTQEIDDALMQAETLLLSCEFNTSDRDAAISLAELLDDYNNGEVGPPHCDKDDDDKDDDDKDDDDKDDDDKDDDDKDDCDKDGHDDDDGRDSD